MDSDEVPGFTVVFDIQPPCPWPPQQNCVLVSILAVGSIDVESCSVTGLPTGQLKIIVEQKKGAPLEIVTVPIRNPSSAPFKIGFAWSDGDCIASIAGKTADSNKPDAPSEIIIPPVTADDTMASTLGEEEKMEWRRERIANRKPRKGRRLRSVTEDFTELIEALQSLQDLRQFVAQGRVYHFDGIASEVRKLICRGNNLDPLLQRCAAILGSPMRVYGTDETASTEDDKLLHHWYFVVGVSRTSNDEKCMDIDYWLETSAALIDGRSYNHNNVLRAFADTEGAHSDKDVEPVVDFMKSLRATSGHDLRGQLLILTTEIIFSLGELMLEQAAQNNILPITAGPPQ